ncbi:putative glycolipid-binding domain-containing protein [Streptomyces griseomycini]|uniref:putative glycolipid-binding domain-containing protein n=1 Tax=Streptomyces griseomycini TaxID=66895 RepID=UPI0019C5D359|nr:putative glycolipid-binding domain-containing protein [Streptomyces griseomycini]GGR49578.1 hypothetical protein GCM10015536_64120 [Streptomyces griseomycini]
MPDRVRARDCGRFRDPAADGDGREDASGTRALALRHDGRGGWTANGERLPDLDGPLDCDPGLRPPTHTMPVLRHGLHRTPGEREFPMAVDHPRPARRLTPRQRSVTLPSATSRRRVTRTASSMRRSWVTSSRVPS